MLARFCAAFGASSSRRSNEALNMLAYYCVLLKATRLSACHGQRAASHPIFLIAKLVESDATCEGSRYVEYVPERCVGELPFEVTRPAIEASQAERRRAAHESRVLKHCNRARYDNR